MKIRSKLEQLRKQLGIKTECEQAFELYNEALKKRRIIYNIYKQGLEAQDTTLQEKALSDMREFCSQKTIKCMRGKCSCEVCYFGFSGIIDGGGDLSSSSLSPSPSSPSPASPSPSSPSL